MSLDKASADITLKEENRITMTQLRQVLKKNGYPTRDAQIEARGRVIARGDKLVVDLLNGSELEIDPKSPVVKGSSEQILQIVGISKGDGKTADRIILQTAR